MKMRRRFVRIGYACAAAVCAFGAVAGAAVDVGRLTAADMFPFVPSYDAPRNVVNMSHLLDAPAGKFGRIRVRDGRFVNDRGPVRLHATNLTGPANFPTHAEAERLAARLARFGINCVRLHYFDTDFYGNFMLPGERCIFAPNDKSRRLMDPERRDRQDYLVAQFKKRGIYIDMNLHVARWLDAREGVAPGSPWVNKGVNQFDPRVIAEEKAYARELLAHVNPYTGMSYLEDPVVAVVELNNEDAIWSQFVGGELDRMSQPYVEVFTELWHAWLARKYGEKREIPVLKSDSDAPEAVRCDFYQFIVDTERAYWTDMRDYLKNDLGLKAPVSATQLGYSPPHVQAELDFVDNHAYWCHPDLCKEWRISNRAMVNSKGGRIAELAAQRVRGKPYIISEYNHPYPVFYGAEGQPMLRAYGALQGWDGVFEYSYNNRQNAEPDRNEFFFSLAARTDVLVHFPACAAIYLRGDVRESRTRCVSNLPYDSYFDQLCKTREVVKGIADGTPAFDAAEGLRHHVAVELNGTYQPGKEAAFAARELGKVIESDTHELCWNLEEPEAGYWTVDTANTKVFTGFANGRTVFLSGVEITVGATKLGWATVSLVSHDATGFGGDGRRADILLAATGLCHNGGAKFTDHGDGCISCRGADWGTGKTVCEGVAATVKLPAPAEKTRCWALDERGARRQSVPVASDNGCASVAISPDYQTVWYEIEVAD